MCPTKLKSTSSKKLDKKWLLLRRKLIIRKEFWLECQDNNTQDSDECMAACEDILKISADCSSIRSELSKRQTYGVM